MNRSSTGADRRGVTLTEVIVSIGIFSILMVALNALFHHSIQYIRRTESMVAMQSDALFAITRINSEAINSNRDAFAFSNGPLKGVVFASPLNASGTPVMDSAGRVQWQRIVVYYLDTLDGVPVMVRKDRPLATPDSEVPTVTDTDLTTIAGDGSLTRKVVARNVIDLQTSFVGNSHEIRLLVESREWGRVFGVEMRTGLFFRN